MIWRISLLGRIEATRGETVISRFESSRVVALLARLALFPRRVHPRETLCELLWPNVDPKVARVRLRHIIAVLRSILEKDVAPGSVVVADRNFVRLNPEAFTTDVARFEKTRAAELYVGELLPGLWDEWILDERARLDAIADAIAQASAPKTETVPESSDAASISPPVSFALPSYLDRFFGRESDHAALAAQVRAHRLVTLCGLGGMGKTRLSLEIARALGSEFPPVFLSLAECVDATRIPDRLRVALSLPAGGDPLAQIALSFPDTPLLLILDNGEQLVESGLGDVIETILFHLPAARVLVTSRRTLDLSGERIFPLEPLPPDARVALFVDRAQAVRPSFRLSDANRAEIDALCAGLDGIPLALELAASRLRARSVSDMLGQISSRLSWLSRAGAKGGHGHRHGSLDATLSWSWRLLRPDQQAFLSALSLFHAGFTAADAAAVTGLSDAPERLEALAAASLVNLSSDDSEGAGPLRYALLPTVREFVRPLDLTGTIQSELDAFCGHFAKNPSKDDNTTAAWEYAISERLGEHAHALASHDDIDWTDRLGVARVIDLLERTCGLPAPDPCQSVRATHRLAVAMLRRNERRAAIEHMETALQSFLADGVERVSPDCHAEAINLRGHVGLYDEPTDEVLSRLRVALALDALPGTRGETLRLMACALCVTPRFEDAEPLLDEAARLYPSEHPGIRRMLVHRAQIARLRQRFDEALGLYEVGIEQSRATDDSALLRLCLSNRADVLAYVGRVDEALAASRECLRTERRLGDTHILLTLLWNLATPLLQTGRAELAAISFSAAAWHWVRDVRPLDPVDIVERDDLRAKFSAALGESAADIAWRTGETQPFSTTLELIDNELGRMGNSRPL